MVPEPSLGVVMHVNNVDPSVAARRRKIWMSYRDSTGSRYLSVGYDWAAKVGRTKRGRTKRYVHVPTSKPRELARSRIFWVVNSS